MARKRIEMKKLRKILKLKHENGLSIREIATLTGVSKTVVSSYLADFNGTGMSYEAVADLSDTELTELFTGSKEEKNKRYGELVALFPHFSKELKKTGVTKQLLWEEYLRDHPDGFQYSQFCHHFQCWQQSQDVRMKQQHEPGEELFVDYTGTTMAYYDRGSEKEHRAEIFVAILGASELTYAEATESQQKEVFVRSVENAFRSFGGATNKVVPDNLKSAVVKACKYEPEINPLFDDFSEYYRTVIIPARAGHPRDKALVENAVRLLYQRVFAPLRNRRFYSLKELNAAIRELVDKHNRRLMLVLKISRLKLFEEIERDHLKQLPSSPYPMKEFEEHTVAPDYHVLLTADKHYYSVPWQLKGKKIRIIYDEKHVALYHDNIRVAQHYRDRKRGGYTTVDEHMPEHHQFYASWSVEKFEAWAASIGKDTFRMIQELLASRRHPEQAFKSCMGILSLAAKCGNDDLNMACRKAWNWGRISYRDVKGYLEEILVQKSLNREDKQVYLFANHKNIRGTAQYC
jgi:transposase